MFLVLQSFFHLSFFVIHWPIRSRAVSGGTNWIWPIRTITSLWWQDDDLFTRYPHTSLPTSPSLITLYIQQPPPPSLPPPRVFEAKTVASIKSTNQRPWESSRLLHHVTATSRSGSVCVKIWAWTCCSHFDPDNQRRFWISQRLRSCEAPHSFFSSIRCEQEFQACYVKLWPGW